MGSRVLHLVSQCCISEETQQEMNNVNKAYPKDTYPLLDICFGYNQIQKHPLDEEKTTFMTEGANFCYRVIPFGLKNVGATY
ncbi:hypothetical protein CR513_61353, partial [Mucuna pruriens]